MTNYRPMVCVGKDEWVGNALVFATYEEANQNARDLMSRWNQVTSTRVDQTDQPVNYTYHDRRLLHVEKESNG
jgi:hypothetical protein